MYDVPEKFLIRHLFAADMPAFRAHLKRLDMETRQSRFGSPVNDQFLDAYVDTAQRLGALIYGAFHEGQIVAAAELRMMDEVSDSMAEAAFSVDPHFQDKGLGTALMDRIITAAQNRRIAELFMICLRDNNRMRHLAGKFGARLKIADGEVTGQIEPAEPTPASLMEESLLESQSFITAKMDWRA